MSETRSRLAELIERSTVSLTTVSSRFVAGDVSADELKECALMLRAMADALTLYADKMPDSTSADRHSLREPPSTL
jgi:hypothetical protein